MATTSNHDAELSLWTSHTEVLRLVCCVLDAKSLAVARVRQGCNCLNSQHDVRFIIQGCLAGPHVAAAAFAAAQAVCTAWQAVAGDPQVTGQA